MYIISLLLHIFVFSTFVKILSDLLNRICVQILFLRVLFQDYYYI